MALKTRFVWVSIAIGTVVVAILIHPVFRTVTHTLLALLPTAIGFVWSAGVLALASVDLDLFSRFAAEPLAK